MTTITRYTGELIFDKNSTNQETVIYTVPAGKVAKIKFEDLKDATDTSRPTSRFKLYGQRRDASDSFSRDFSIRLMCAGSVVCGVYSMGVGGTALFYASVGRLTGEVNYYGSTTALDTVDTSELYLMEGESISIANYTDPSASSTRPTTWGAGYNFFAIEEDI